MRPRDFLTALYTLSKEFENDWLIVHLSFCCSLYRMMIMRVNQARGISHSVNGFHQSMITRQSCWACHLERVGWPQDNKRIEK
jgi:hypothetical protein